MSASTKGSNLENNDQFIAAIRELKFSMNFFGIWPRACSGNWYDLVWYVQSLGLAFSWSGAMVGLLVNMDDTDVVVDSLSLLIPMTSFFLKWITFHLQRESMKELLYCMGKDWNDLVKNTGIGQSVPNREGIMCRYSRIPRIFFITAVTMLMGCTIFHVEDSLSSRNSPNKFLPVPHAWYPLDYDRGFNFELLVVVQAVTSSTLAVSNISIDSLFVTATLHLCGQFRILRVAEGIQKAYNYQILIQLATTTLTVCFLGYSFITEIERDHVRPTVVLKTGSACGGMLMLMFSYCIVGDMLTNQSAAVTVAVYNAQWYACTKSINRSLVFVMARAGKPVKITGAKLLPMSLETFMAVLKLSASYLSVLRAVNVK